jgi:hypothetical protein
MNTIWAPEKQMIDDAALLARVSAMTYAGREPGAQPLVGMLAAISRAILADPRARLASQYIALGYWLRPSALQQLRDDLVKQTNDSGALLAPRGVALHLPPTNVDTIFVYSWALSVLAGNANVVRLAEKLTADTEWLVSLIACVVAEHGEDERQLFCSYPYGDAFEQRISRQCDLRMIWGGDAKVETVSRTAIRPDGLSIGFPDRKSLSLIGVDSYARADEKARDELATQLYNDTYWFDQMGCGSPRLVVWIGEKSDTLSDDLYARLGKAVAAKKIAVETGVAIGKMALANDLLAEGVADRLRFFSNELVVVDIVDPVVGLERTHGGGFLGEYTVADIADIANFTTRKVQTLGHFGFSSEELKRLARAISGRGGYRIVPIGQALQFDVTWDGMELFVHMTRRITIWETSWKQAALLQTPVS